MKSILCKSQFAGGVICGAALAVAAMLFVANPASQVRATSLQQEPGQFFVTGDQFSATVWRLEIGGTLTCVSHNLCREPTVAPERIDPHQRRVPGGPRTPTGPSKPLTPQALTPARLESNFLSVPPGIKFPISISYQ